ncbi:MAG TPA: iron-sulfur cluster assembly protein [Bellilinea sp.]|jgi:metal-sulfur cluster biosynthetic enzyme|nr:iron-sulfur cluster assembly protein [Bellilinea sp.]
MEQATLLRALVEKLTTVVDPETGENVIRMQLVQNLQISDDGKVTYTFRPSSPLCPIAVPLALMIITAVGEVSGVTGQNMTVIDYVEADKLNEILKTVFAE